MAKLGLKPITKHVKHANKQTEGLGLRLVSRRGWACWMIWGQMRAGGQGLLGQSDRRSCFSGQKSTVIFAIVSTFSTKMDPWSWTPTNPENFKARRTGFWVQPTWVGGGGGAARQNFGWGVGGGAKILFGESALGPLGPRRISARCRFQSEWCKFSPVGVPAFGFQLGPRIRFAEDLWGLKLGSLPQFSC